MQVNPTSLNPSDPAVDRVPIQTLGQSDFLKLLATQMSSQDPLNPMTDTSFIAQMTQFSMMEQNKDMQTDLGNLQAGQQVAEAQSLLGRTVIVQDSAGTVSTGVVTAVQMDQGTPNLIVNGQPHLLSEVQTISPTLNN